MRSRRIPALPLVPQPSQGVLSESPGRWGSSAKFQTGHDRGIPPFQKPRVGHRRSPYVDRRRGFCNNPSMLHLTTDQLDSALNAVLAHGYGDFFPDPPELSLLVNKWEGIRDELSKVDLDQYDGHDVIFAFAPKSRFNV